MILASLGWTPSSATFKVSHLAAEVQANPPASNPSIGLIPVFPESKASQTSSDSCPEHRPSLFL